MFESLGAFSDLYALEKLLRSRPEQVTFQEESLMWEWKTRAVSYFSIGFAGGLAVPWLDHLMMETLMGSNHWNKIRIVYGREKLCMHISMFQTTPRLIRSLHLALTSSTYQRLRLALPICTAYVCGSWLYLRSFRTSVEHILSLEGSRIQREMANVMLKRRHDDPWVRLVISKHFYPEEVYVDSSTDKPVFKLHYRNFSGESVTHSQSTTSYGAEQTNPKEKKIDNTRKLEPGQQVTATAAAADTEDLFDLVLGVSGSANDDDPQTTNAPLEPSGRQTRKGRQSRRKHRRQHRHEESDDG